MIILLYSHALLNIGINPPKLYRDTKNIMVIKNISAYQKIEFLLLMIEIFTKLIFHHAEKIKRRHVNISVRIKQRESQNYFTIKVNNLEHNL